MPPLPARHRCRVAPRLASVILAAAIMLGTGCSNRDRSNPLDPQNLSAEPNPWSFVALAGDQRVRLRWQPLAFDDLETVVIERRGPGASDSVTARIELPLALAASCDSLLENDRTYRYSLLPQLADGRVVAPVGPLPATPGPELCWVTDTFTSGNPLRQLAPDGRTVLLERGGFRSPGDVSVAGTSGIAWIADAGNRRVVAVDRRGTEIRAVDGFIRPCAVSAAEDGSLWVADEGSGLSDGAAVRLSAAGTELARTGGFTRPTDVAVREADGAAWLSDGASGALWLLGAMGDTLLHLEGRYREPLQLAAVVEDGSVWLSDDELEVVARVGPDGTELARLELAPGRPFGIAVDPQSGDLWLTMNRAGTVERWTAAGDQLLVLAGFDRPLGIALNPRDGTIWVADHTRIYKLSPDGEELASLAGFSQPLALDLDPGPAGGPPAAPARGWQRTAGVITDHSN